ncbi:collagen alpha-1(XII) chain-like [Patella vulgata]|uniref:collagen alpha-1(XII) chain-like n=1 Tax=Patella vulgata TaxID=6465 RepID=UPI0024A8C7A5|nr:collagen alpha-1(XII) chain-like [Patella vulgata]
MYCCKQLVSVIIFCAISLNSQKYDEGQRDIVLLLDSSGSVGAHNFYKSKLFVRNFVDSLQIAADKVQVSLILFSTKPKKIFWLNDFSDKAKIKSVVMKIPYRGGSTATAHALRFTNDYVLSNDHGDREAAPDLIIVITDGKSNKPEETISSAKVLHDRGVDIVSIGVGDKVDATELHTIASDRNLAIQVDNFDKLNNLKTTLFQAACEGLKTTTRRTTAIEVTSARRLTDTTLYKMFSDVATDSTEQTGSDRPTNMYDSYNTRSLITATSEDFTTPDSSGTTSESFTTPNPSGTTATYITNDTKPGRYFTTPTNSRTRSSFKTLVDLNIETTTSTMLSTTDFEGTVYSNMAERHTTVPFTTSTLVTKKAQQPLTVEIPDELMTNSSLTRSSRSFVKSKFKLSTFQTRIHTFKKAQSRQENHSTTETVLVTENNIYPITVSFQNKTTMVNLSTDMDTNGTDKLNLDKLINEWATIVGITTGAALLGAAAFGTLIWVLRRRHNRESNLPAQERDV